MKKEIIMWKHIDNIVGNIIYVSEDRRGIKEIMIRFKRCSGIYIIWNKINNKLYIGSTGEFECRFSFYYINKFPNKQLKEDIEEYGWKNMRLIIVRSGKYKANWEELEYSYIRGFKKVCDIYNVRLYKDSIKK